MAKNFDLETMYVLIHRRPNPDGCLERDRLGEIRARRRKHKPSKAHATGKAQATVRRKRAGKRAYRMAMRALAQERWDAAVKAYWRGELDEHPTA